MRDVWMCETEQAYWFEFEEPHDMPDDVKVTKLVPHREWISLTAEDKKRIIDSNFGGSRADCMDAAERALREKNHGTQA